MCVSPAMRHSVGIVKIFERNDMSKLITLPGIGGSGDTHWQTLWEREDTSILRFAPTSWDNPDLTDWVNTLENAVASVKEPPVLIAHSLACLLVPHWMKRTELRVMGVFLVAVPDPDGPVFPAQAHTFKNVPEDPISVPSVLITSSNDPYGTVEYAHKRADQWRSSIIEIGTCGHINENSGIGEWEQGRALLNAFVAGTAASV